MAMYVFKPPLTKLLICDAISSSSVELYVMSSIKASVLFYLEVG